LDFKFEPMTESIFQEFVADEGKIYIPYWMLQNLMLEEGGLVQVNKL